MITTSKTDDQDEHTESRAVITNTENNNNAPSRPHRQRISPDRLETYARSDLTGLINQL